MTICNYEQAALDVGAVHYSPGPLRAVKGISFTYDQLTEFSEKLKSAERQKVLAEMSQIEPVSWIGKDMKYPHGGCRMAVDELPLIIRPEAPQPAAQGEPK